MARTIYISGLITDGGRLPIADARQRFEAARMEVANLGYVPITPFEVCDAAGLASEGDDWRAYMRANIRTLLEVDGVYMLRGWWASKGARTEHMLATALDLIVLYQLEDN